MLVMLKHKKDNRISRVCGHKVFQKLLMMRDSRMQWGADPFHRVPSQKSWGDPARTPPSSQLEIKMGECSMMEKNEDKFGCSSAWLVVQVDKKLNN